MSQKKEGLFSLKDKVIIVSGGTGILGGAFVKAIAEQEAKVVIIGRNEKVGNSRVSEINNHGGNAIFIAADVLDEAQLINAREKIIAIYGRIDGLVNAAGGNIPAGVLPPEREVFDLNIEGVKSALIYLGQHGPIVKKAIEEEYDKEIKNSHDKQSEER
jgi:NAD(P)-dependent dehydrogenase (short-subunit alcohol dehydrogenase family)